MNNLQKTIISAALTMLAFAPGAMAMNWNQRTVFTFSGPVEIPGHVLPAGTYVFKLASSPTHRHIVQVFTADEKRVINTFFAIPDYRLTASEKTIITFAERPAGEPQAVKGWFYPGMNYGHEFVYPKTEAAALAVANETPVPSVPDGMTIHIATLAIRMTAPEIAAADATPLKAEEPNGREVEIAEAFDSPDSVAAAGAPEADKLPETGSALPLIGMIGLISLGSAATLRLARAKSK